MPTPMVDFESNFRSAETLLNIYRLLDSPDGPKTEHALIRGVRELLMARDDEEIILLVNELFLGAVREHANLRPAVFRRDNLALLLRQAVVAACSAMDVYYPALLKAHLPRLILVKQRNFLPTDKMTKGFLNDFVLTLEEILRMLSDPEPAMVLGEFFAEYLKRKTLANSTGVGVTLQILGIEDPWARIAGRLGTTKEPLIKQFDALVNRRNDIVHRGDRGAKDPSGPPQEIYLAWTENQVRLARAVTLASEELVDEQVALLPPLQPSAPDPVSGREESLATAAVNTQPLSDATAFSTAAANG